MALIPAHNEAQTIVATIQSLRAQTTPPDQIVVIADNCTDGTVSRAKHAGAEVFETTGNMDKKASALNQALLVYPTSATEHSRLADVAAARADGTLPGSGIYKQSALTEDNELSPSATTRSASSRSGSPSSASICLSAGSPSAAGHGGLRPARSPSRSKIAYDVFQQVVLARAVWG